MIRSNEKHYMTFHLLFFDLPLSIYYVVRKIHSITDRRDISRHVSREDRNSSANHIEIRILFRADIYGN